MLQMKSFSLYIHNLLHQHHFLNRLDFSQSTHLLITHLRFLRLRLWSMLTTQSSILSNLFFQRISFILVTRFLVLIDMTMFDMTMFPMPGLKRRQPASEILTVRWMVVRFKIKITTSGTIFSMILNTYFTLFILFTFYFSRLQR
jgi:hypothetical protein